MPQREAQYFAQNRNCLVTGLYSLTISKTMPQGRRSLVTITAPASCRTPLDVETCKSKTVAISERLSIDVVQNYSNPVKKGNNGEMM